jgi:ferric-dicitrate binding protein FerR (iron transport regulator)
MTEELLIKYISGQTDPTETEAVLNWVEVSDEREKEITRLKNIWIISGIDQDINSFLKSREIDRIMAIIREENLRKQRKKHLNKILAYAAGFLVVVGLSTYSGFYLSQKVTNSNQAYTEIYVPKGERTSVLLPDGSKVQLNSDSRLRFESTLSVSKKRKVSLSGEGYFDVKPDSAHPFIVETPSYDIEVLGTSFDVSCYPNDSLITTFLKHGKVKISKDNSKPVYLTPSELYCYNTSTFESSKKKVDDSRYADWTKGRFTIAGETIGDLAKKLERRFNISIVFGDAEAKNHMYSGSIKDEDLNTMLEALTYASTIKYEHKGDTIVLYSKK